MPSHLTGDHETHVLGKFKLKSPIYIALASKTMSSHTNRVLPYFTMFSELNMVRYKILQTNLLQSCIFNILIDCSVTFPLGRPTKVGLDRSSEKVNW